MKIFEDAVNFISKKDALHSKEEEKERNLVREEAKQSAEYAKSAVLKESEDINEEYKVVGGINFENCRDLDSLLNSFMYTGFQATNLHKAIEEINKMLSWRLIDEEITEDEKGTIYENEEVRKNTKCTIWLSFTSNMISSGLREIFVFLAKHKYVDVIVTSAGGVEEDVIKCLEKTYIGDFDLKGEFLRKMGWNRIGNLLVPNKNYCAFEDFMQPLLTKMVDEQNERNLEFLHNFYLTKKKDKLRASSSEQPRSVLLCSGGGEGGERNGGICLSCGNSAQEESSNSNCVHCLNGKSSRSSGGIGNKSSRSCSYNDVSCNNTNYRNYFEEDGTNSYFAWTPSSFIERLGKEISNEQSLCYWCYRNNIPIFCPALTDGSLGDNIYFHTYRKSGLVIDLVQDIRRINDLGMNCKKSGIIILGGGVSKHHVCNANLMRNGCDFAVYINSGHDFDGSDSGALPDEAISWGKIKSSAKPVKLFGDASILFPLVVAATFAKHFHQKK